MAENWRRQVVVRGAFIIYNIIATRVFTVPNYKQIQLIVNMDIWSKDVFIYIYQVHMMIPSRIWDAS